jgi:hypothetical protein
MLQSRFKVGEIEVIPFVASRFRLDGGSMFGVVPKVLWEKRAPADGLNRIELSVNSLMVSSLDKKMLVEPGMGSKQDEKLRRIYALEPLDASSALDRLGYSPDDIDIVVPTHLHLDHAGGSTLRGQSQEIRDAFPRAWYIVQELEWEAASDPGPLERGSYDPADYTSLAETGRLSIVMGTTEIAKGVRVGAPGGAHEVSGGRGAVPGRHRPDERPPQAQLADGLGPGAPAGLRPERKAPERRGGQGSHVLLRA